MCLHRRVTGTPERTIPSGIWNAVQLTRDERHFLAKEERVNEVIHGA